jgi:ABC-type multidrug transport system fused ATPase/permease subunit
MNSAFVSHFPLANRLPCTLARDISWAVRVSKNAVRGTGRSRQIGRAVISCRADSKGDAGFALVPPDADVQVHVFDKPKNDGRLLDPLLRFAQRTIGESRSDVIVAGVSMLFCISSGACAPLMLGRAMNALVVVASNPCLSAYKVFMKYVAFAMISFAVDVLASYVYIRKMTASFDRSLLRLKKETFGSIVQLDSAFYNITGSDQVTSALSTDPSELRETIWGNLQRDRGFRAFGEAVVGIFVVLALSWRLALIYVAVVPVVATVNVLGGMILGKLAGEESEARALASAAAAESLSAFSTVQTFGAAKRESRKFSTMLESADRVSLRLGRRKALNDFTGRFGLYMTLVLFLSVGGYMVAAGVIPLSTYLPMQPFIWILNFSFQGVLYTLSDVEKAGSYLRRIFGVMDKAAYHWRYVMPDATRKLESVLGDVEFVAVRFAYPSRRDSAVLQSLNLRINRGKVTALVGQSGAGKSTIGALLCKLYTPQGGRILLDGTDIATLDREWYSEQVAVVNQEPVLLTGTIREAIEYGAPDRLHPVAESAIVHAAKLANAHDFISALPEGYETQVGSRGGNLSGGQRQRIAIARAILRDAPILLLDEATSALDSESERLVQEALNWLMERKTCLVIAHRLSTIKDADKIIVIGQGGKPLEQGSYKELMRTNGAFSELMRTQTTAFVGD